MSDRYFVTEDGVEREVDRAEFIRMERACGFHRKGGGDGFATAGFSQTLFFPYKRSRSGRIERGTDDVAGVL